MTLHLEVSFESLTSGATAAHIHGLTPTPLTGVAGIAVMEPSLPDFPIGVTTGTYEATIDLTVASSYSPAFITASGGTVSDALNALIFGMSDGRTYFSIRSSSFPGGEIRGFLNEIRGPLTADMNCDGQIDNFDIDPFVLALTDPVVFSQQYPDCHVLNADINHDELVNNFDIDLFVECISVGCE